MGKLAGRLLWIIKVTVKWNGDPIDREEISPTEASGLDGERHFLPPSEGNQVNYDVGKNPDDKNLLSELFGQFKEDSGLE